MNDKTMVSDALVSINNELKMYADYISQSENKELKQMLKQFRNECEMSQEKLYNLAREKSFYVPAAKATQEEVQHVKSVLTQCVASNRYARKICENFSKCPDSGIPLRGVLVI